MEMKFGNLPNKQIDYITSVYLAAAIPGPPVNITVLPGVREAVISWDNNGAKATMYTLLYRQKQSYTSPWNKVRKSIAQKQFSQSQ